MLNLRKLNPLVSFIRTKYTIDYSRVPQIIESDLEEQHIRGSGPGGQSVAKTSNCVLLRHIPSGVVVKCHETRSLDQNRKRARQILITKLDNMLNKDDSVEAQIKAQQQKKTNSAERKRQKLNILKEEWKKRENLD